MNDSLNIKTTPFHLFESKVPLDVCDKLREANSAITDSKFLSNIMSEKVAEWESISNSKFKQSVDFKKVMKNVNPNALNTIASPGLPPEFSRVVSSLVLPKSNYEYLVQMIKCSHIDWHSDKYVLNKELKCVDGILFQQKKPDAEKRGAALKTVLLPDYMIAIQEASILHIFPTFIF